MPRGKVVVVPHQAVGVTEPPETLHLECEDLQERPSVRVVKEDLLSSVAAAGDVVHCAFVLVPKRPRHGTVVRQLTPRVKK